MYNLSITIEGGKLRFALLYFKRDIIRKLQHYKKRLITAIMIIALLPLHVSGLSVAAVEATPNQVASDNRILQPITLSLEDAFERAINNYTALKSLDVSLKRLWKVNDKDGTFTTMDAAVTKKLNKLDNYFELFDRKTKSDRGENVRALNTNELDELLDCKKVFGDILWPYSKEMMFESYTQRSTFPQYSGWLQVQKIKNSRDVMKSQLKDTVWMTYDTVLYLKEMNDLRKQSLEIEEKQYNLLQLQYKKGLVTELDTYQCQVSLDKTKRELIKVQRSIENMEMQLKNLCGIPFSQEIELISTEIPADTKLLPYNTYYQKACENRDEIVYPKLELEVLTRELDILNGYKKNSYSFDKVELNEKIEDAKASIPQGLETVTSDIQWAYADVTAIGLNMDISKKNADNAKTKLSIMETKYKQGQVNFIELCDARYSASAAQVEYRKAQRDFARASNKLNLASGLGPKYKQD